MDQDEVDLLQYLKVLYKWKWAILVLLVSSSLTAFIVSSRITPVYQASASAMVKADVASAGFPFLEGAPGLANNAAQNYVELLKSRTMLELAISRLGWDVPVESEEFQKLREGISVQLVSGTNTLRVSADSTDPVKAALLANTMIDVLIEQSQRSNQESFRSAREFIEKQLKISEGQLKRAEQALLDYKTSQRVVAPTEETKAQIEKIVSLETALAETQVALEEAVANRDQIQKALRSQDPTLMTSETIVGNPLVEQYKARLADLEASLAGAREKYTDKHPYVLSLNAEIREIKDRLSQEVERVVSAQTKALNPIHQELVSQLIKAQAQIMGMEAKREALRALIAESEAAFAAIPEKELNLTRLMREQRVAEEIYVMLLTKYEETKITEAMKLADIQPLDRAIVPRDPIKPRKLLNVAIAAFLGLFVGIGLAFIMEFMDISFKSQDEVERVLGLPVLGFIPSMKRFKGKRAISNRTV
ncbi:MAG TPA: hypothetical protein GX506_03715 [Firmicutes bacterium]|nr:hypothetical protein [Bacillota bacterium]